MHIIPVIPVLAACLYIALFSFHIALASFYIALELKGLTSIVARGVINPNNYQVSCQL